MQEKNTILEIPKKKTIEIPMYYDVWLDNGIVTLYSILKESENNSFNVELSPDCLRININDFSKFKDTVANAIKNRRSNLIVIEKDKKFKEKKEIKKDYILIQEETKDKSVSPWRVVFKEGIYNEKTVNDVIEKIFDLITEEGYAACIICGRSFSKSIKKLQQASYPLVTKIKSLSGVRSYKNGKFYSLKEYFDNFCPICYLVGIIEWTDKGIIYRTIPGEKSILFLPQSDNLLELRRFKETYHPLLNTNHRYHNIKVKRESEETENTYGSFSTLLCFYEKFFSYTKRNDKVRNSWAMIDIPFGPVKNIKLNNIEISSSILQIIKKLSEEKINIYKEIIESFLFFNDNPKGAPINWELTGEIRENISEAILTDNFRFFAKNLLPRKGGHVGVYLRDVMQKDVKKNLEELIYLWRLKNMGLNEKQLETIKSAGRTIAAASKSHRSLLYKLDKVKDKTDLLDALRQISRKIAGLKPEEKKKYKGFIYSPALEDTVSLIEQHERDEKFIEDLKNILIIFSCVEFSRIEYLEEKKEGEENE